MTGYGAGERVYRCSAIKERVNRGDNRAPDFRVELRQVTRVRTGGPSGVVE